MPTQVHWSIRVWTNVSFSMFTVRAAGSLVRPGAGPPARTTAVMRRTAMTVTGIVMAVTASETMIATSCMEPQSLVRRP